MVLRIINTNFIIFFETFKLIVCIFMNFIHKLENQVLFTNLTNKLFSIEAC